MTESDRELLELAAKAAGLINPMPALGCGIVHGGGMYWNPLTDDGDALRLAVKLGLFSDTGLTYQFMEAKDCESTRRAIVIAAAAIARATHKEQKCSAG